MNSIIGTYSLQYATIRYYAGADNDIALTRACDQLVLAGYLLSKTGTNVVSGNSNQYYLYWTRPEGVVPPVPFVPVAVENVTWVDADAPVV